jgi:hypothetical protein
VREKDATRRKVARTGERARVVATREGDVGEQEGPHEAPSSLGLCAVGGGIVVVGDVFVLVAGEEGDATI